MRRLLTFLCLSVAIAPTAAPDPASARPTYRAVFVETYPDLKEVERTRKCYTCHCERPARSHNDYGVALKKALKGKNVKDRRKVEAALRSVETEASSEQAKTFGDLINEGRLPGICPPPKGGHVSGAP